MKSAEISKMAEMEDNYWWHIGKKGLVSSLIKKHFPDRTKSLSILEIGCGTGGLTTILSNFGQVTAFDISPDAVDFCKNRGISNVQIVDISTLSVEKYKGSFDLILMLDVLEHIQDDVLVMQKVKDMLTEEGLFFINVPAHKFLWSEHDEALEHKRRYHRLELLRKLKDSGFFLISYSYFVCLVSPIIVLYRFWGNIFGKSAYPRTSYVVLPNWLNNFFVKLLEIETKLLLRTSLPFGVTLNVVAKKNPDSYKL
jgi:2-polyprenyl-3-methyl-5-hydroxy-6-metoxy-1,4-benzoquinol methylase